MTEQQINEMALLNIMPLTNTGGRDVNYNDRLSYIKGVKDFSDKLTEGFNRVVPKHLREDEPVDKDKENSFSNWVQKLRDKF